MKALVIAKHGGPESLRWVDRDRPEPGPNEVRVQIKAFSLNHLDVWVRKGVPGHHFPLPLIASSDGAGTIDAVGAAVTRWKPGDEVVLTPAHACGQCEMCWAGKDNLCRDYHILGESRDGVAAEYVCVPQGEILEKPKGLSFEHAAAGLLSFLTAWHMLVSRAKLLPGETLLVHAGASGVGLAAIQIARFRGARVLATAGSSKKLELCASLGAEVTVDYKTGSFVQAVREWTGKRGVDVVFEHVGAATWDDSLRALSWGGRLVTCGATSGHEVTLDLRKLFFKNWSVLGSSMGTKGELKQILTLQSQGLLRPVVSTVLAPSQIHEGHRQLELREAIGKVVFTMEGLK